jgi:hypothetical protein
MSSATASAPTLFLHPRTACPRCDAGRVLALATNVDSAFAWYECEECRHLWALPYGWMPYAGSLSSPPANRSAR